MAKEIDSKKIEECIKEILIALGDDPSREGLKDTPKRVAKMYEEVFEGMKYTNEEIADMFNTSFEEDYVEKSNNMVVIKDIPIFSYCEHHLALMYNMNVSVVYIPNKKIIGLSKVARIADMVSKRLQLQERICSDICEIISLATDSDDIGVLVSGEHSCMSARGIKKIGSKTITTVFKGIFMEDQDKRREALELMK